MRFRSLPFCRLLLFLCAILGSVVVASAQQDDIVAKPDTPPVPVKTPPPKHPEDLRRQGVSGVVAVVLVIDNEGKVVDASIKKSSQPEFEEPTLEAVRQWRFKPATKDGAPVKVRVAIPIHFNLD